MKTMAKLETKADEPTNAARKMINAMMICEKG